MFPSVQTGAIRHDEADNLVAINARNGSLYVRGDGQGRLTIGGANISFGRDVGRYVLRRLYLQQWSKGPGAVRALAAEIERCRLCHRFDCGIPIPALRQQQAFERDHPAKWCSIRCQRTEATRRYRQRHSR